ncbi:MAG: HAMP domain-containing histidine kinase [Gammaproteobacteria bacterium]|nr:HAMP domain-containing histidine kinase [Gammaproteobacteria bacterium]
MTSLRKKITLSYSLLAGLIFLLSVFAYADLLFLESHIEEGSVVTLLKDDVLEMRRHEKNLLLYRTPETLPQILHFLQQTRQNLQSHQSLYSSLVGANGLTALLAELKIYEELFVDAPSLLSGPDTLNPVLFNDIRKQGHIISETVNKLALDERLSLISMANRSQWALAGAILIMALLAIVIGWQMTRLISRPLQQLEKRLAYIANGRFDFLKPVTQDQEFIAFTKAFNRMLHELDLRHRRLLQAEKLASLGVLVSGVAHELNNPLGNISSSCQLLLEELDEAKPEQQQEWLQQIDNETERARNIVKTLLDYGQKREFNRQALLLKDILDKSLLLLRNQLKRSATIKLDIPEGFTIRADMQRMQQVFINLVRNALNAGGVNVQINIQASAAGQVPLLDEEGIQFVGESHCLMGQMQEYCEIVITDNGPGIAKDVMRKIFDPFFTTSEPGHGAGHGTGLGLYIVQEIIQEHEGCIGVSSSDKGTQFVIRLPCARNSGDDVYE